MTESDQKAQASPKRPEDSDEANVLVRRFSIYMCRSIAVASELYRRRRADPHLRSIINTGSCGRDRFCRKARAKISQVSAYSH